jgi:biotin carboxyl carrier protein
MEEQEKREFLNIDESLYLTRLSTRFRNRVKYQPSDPGKILSFIPGTVTDILVTAGQAVKAGDVLLILDAMKMQNRLKCPFDGRIRSILVNKGERVAKGVLLVELDPDPDIT